MALAAVAASERRVVIMDGDFSRPGVGSLLANPPTTGWDDYLQGTCTFADAVRFVDSRQMLPVVPLGQTSAEADRLLDHAGLPALLGRLRDEYDLVVLDGGAVGEGGARWATRSDVALVVCDSGHTLADDWAQTWDRLEEGGTHVLGIVETLTAGKAS
jgi:Mrp family chromosome partitioning ATPase